MLLLSYHSVCFVVLAGVEVTDVLLPAETIEMSSHFRRLEQEDFTKTSPNFFDLSPDCVQLGDRYCDYSAHNLGSGSEFASWEERTQFVYANMARMDFKAFQKAPYNAKYSCSPKSGLVPFYWSSEVTQAARFHSHEMATLNFFSHDTSPQNGDLFGNSLKFSKRMMSFVTSPGRGMGENIAAGRGSPLAVTNQWLGSSGHCTQIFGSLPFLGVGYFYNPSSRFRHYWTENFFKGPQLPTQDFVAGTHDITSGTNRFLAQVHMAQAPTKVSVVVGSTTKTMALLLGSAKTGTYFVDIDTLTGADSDGCVPYYFEVNSGASRMPSDKLYHFLTYGVNNCKRNIGKGGNTQPSATTQPLSGTTLTCLCPNGVAKTGADCTAAGATMCARCNSGYSLSNNECKANVKVNVCKCPNGNAKTGSACTNNGAVLCASCKSGYSLSNNKCKLTTTPTIATTAKPATTTINVKTPTTKPQKPVQGKWKSFGSNTQCDAGAGEVYLAQSSAQRSSLEQCKQSCQDESACKSITYFASGHCSHFSTPCTKTKSSDNGVAMQLSSNSASTTAPVSTTGSSASTATATGTTAMIGDTPSIDDTDEGNDSVKRTGGMDTSTPAWAVSDDTSRTISAGVWIIASTVTALMTCT